MEPGGGAGGRSDLFMLDLVAGVGRNPTSARAADPTEGRTTMADGQWWADRLGNRQAEGGSAVASWSFYSPEAGTSGEMFRPWGAARLQRSSRRRRIPAPLPKEDGRVLAYRHVPPCGQGSINPASAWGCGPALPSPSPRARRRQPGRGLGGTGGGGHWRGELVRGPPTAPPPPRWHGVPTS